MTSWHFFSQPVLLSTYYFLQDTAIVLSTHENYMLRCSFVAMMMEENTMYTLQVGITSNRKIK